MDARDVAKQAAASRNAAAGLHRSSNSIGGGTSGVNSSVKGSSGGRAGSLNGFPASPTTPAFTATKPIAIIPAGKSSALPTGPRAGAFGASRPLNSFKGPPPSISLSLKKPTTNGYTRSNNPLLSGSLPAKPEKQASSSSVASLLARISSADQADAGRAVAQDMRLDTARKAAETLSPPQSAGMKQRSLSASSSTSSTGKASLPPKPTQATLEASRLPSTASLRQPPKLAIAFEGGSSSGGHRSLQSRFSAPTQTAVEVAEQYALSKQRTQLAKGAVAKSNVFGDNALDKEEEAVNAASLTAFRKSILKMPRRSPSPPRSGPSRQSTSASPQKNVVEANLPPVPTARPPSLPPSPRLPSPRRSISPGLSAKQIGKLRAVDDEDIPASPARGIDAVMQVETQSPARNRMTRQTSPGHQPLLPPKPLEQPPAIPRPPSPAPGLTMLPLSISLAKPLHLPPKPPDPRVFNALNDQDSPLLADTVRSTISLPSKPLPAAFSMTSTQSLDVAKQSDSDSKADLSASHEDNKVEPALSAKPRDSSRHSTRPFDPDAVTEPSFFLTYDPVLDESKVKRSSKQMRIRGKDLTLPVIDPRQDRLVHAKAMRHSRSAALTDVKPLTYEYFYGSPGPCPARPPNHHLVITGLDKLCTIDKIRLHFKQYGVIDFCELALDDITQGSLCIASVTYKDERPRPVYTRTKVAMSKHDGQDGHACVQLAIAKNHNQRLYRFCGEQGTMQVHVDPDKVNFVRLRKEAIDGKRKQKADEERQRRQRIEDEKAREAAKLKAAQQQAAGAFTPASTVVSAHHGHGDLRSPQRPSAPVGLAPAHVIKPPSEMTQRHPQARTNPLLVPSKNSPQQAKATASPAKGGYRLNRAAHRGRSPTPSEDSSGAESDNDRHGSSRPRDDIIHQRRRPISDLILKKTSDDVMQLTKQVEEMRQRLLVYNELFRDSTPFIRIERAELVRIQCTQDDQNMGTWLNTQFGAHLITILSDVRAFYMTFPGSHAAKKYYEIFAKRLFNRFPLDMSLEDVPTRYTLDEYDREYKQAKFKLSRLEDRQAGRSRHGEWEDRHYRPSSRRSRSRSYSESRPRSRSRSAEPAPVTRPNVRSRPELSNYELLRTAHRQIVTDLVAACRRDLREKVVSVKVVKALASTSDPHHTPSARVQQLQPLRTSPQRPHDAKTPSLTLPTYAMNAKGHIVQQLPRFGAVKASTTSPPRDAKLPSDDQPSKTVAAATPIEAESDLSDLSDLTDLDELSDATSNDAADQRLPPRVLMSPVSSVDSTVAQQNEKPKPSAAKKVRSPKKGRPKQRIDFSSSEEEDEVKLKPAAKDQQAKTAAATAEDVEPIPITLVTVLPPDDQSSTPAVLELRLSEEPTVRRDILPTPESLDIEPIEPVSTKRALSIELDDSTVVADRRPVKRPRGKKAKRTAEDRAEARRLVNERKKAKLADAQQDSVLDESTIVDEEVVHEIQQILPAEPPREPTPDPFKLNLVSHEEDLYYLRLVLEKQQAGAAFMPTVMPPEDENTYQPVHDNGCARVEPYYKIPQAEKLSYLAARNQAQVGEQPSSSIAVSRLARVNARQLVSGLDKHKKAAASDVDVLQFNQLRTRKKQLRFARSPIHDWGLYAKEHILPGDMVIEYVGESIRAQVAELREKYYERQGIGSSYLFRVDDDVVIDATMKGNLGRLINHCCTPNCTARILSVGNSKKIVIYAKQSINEGDEITYDYHFPIEDEKIPCLCGSSGCRGYLN